MRMSPVVNGFCLGHRVFILHEPTWWSLASGRLSYTRPLTGLPSCCLSERTCEHCFADVGGSYDTCSDTFATSGMMLLVAGHRVRTGCSELPEQGKWRLRGSADWVLMWKPEGKA